MSMSMSLTSGVHENSKWEPDDSDAESIESKSSAARVSMSNFMSDGSEKRSVSESRSASVDSPALPPTVELIIRLGSCLMIRPLLTASACMSLTSRWCPPSLNTIDWRPKCGNDSSISDSASGSGVSVVRPGSLLMLNEPRLSSVDSPLPVETLLLLLLLLLCISPLLLLLLLELVVTCRLWSSYMVRLAGESGMSDDGLDGTLATAGAIGLSN